MSTIQMTKRLEPKPDSLVESNKAKKDNKLSIQDMTQNSHFCANDLIGLSWVLFDELEMINIQK